MNLFLSYFPLTGNFISKYMFTIDIEQRNVTILQGIRMKVFIYIYIVFLENSFAILYCYFECSCFLIPSTSLGPPSSSLINIYIVM